MVEAATATMRRVVLSNSYQEDDYYQNKKYPAPPTLPPVRTR